MSEERLSRIEDKLDKMSEAITLLARIEERMVTLFKRMDKHDDIVGKLIGRVESIESGRTRTEVVSSFLNKIFWLVVGAIVVTVVKLWSPDA
jgi:predicted DNA repair protein MutK